MQIRPLSSATDFSLFASKNRKKMTAETQRNNNASSPNSKQLSAQYLAALTAPTRNSTYENSKIQGINEFLKSTRGGLEDLAILESELNRSTLLNISRDDIPAMFEKVSSIYWDRIGLPFSRIELEKLYSIFPRASYVFALRNFEKKSLQREMSRIYLAAYPLSTFSINAKDTKFRNTLRDFAQQLPLHFDSQLYQSLPKLFAESLKTIQPHKSHHQVDHPSSPDNKIMMSLNSGVVLLCREILESLKKDFPKDLLGISVDQQIGSGVSSTGSKLDLANNNFHKHTSGFFMEEEEMTIHYADHEPPHTPNSSKIFSISFSPEGQVIRFHNYVPKKGLPKPQQGLPLSEALRFHISTAIFSYLPQNAFPFVEKNHPRAKAKVSYRDPETNQIKKRWLTLNDPLKQKLNDYSNKYLIAYRSFLKDLDVRNHK